MERFVIIVNGFLPLTIIIKLSDLDVAAVLDPLLVTGWVNNKHMNVRRLSIRELETQLFATTYI